MRERRARTARQDGRHESPLSSQALVANGVDASVDTVEVAGGAPLSHSVCRPASRAKLGEGGDSMLPRRKGSDTPTDRWGLQRSVR